MKKAGLDVIGFAAGEPDFNTPGPICEAAIQAIHRGETKYTPSSGTPALREAVAAKLLRENGIKAIPDEVVVSVGAKHSIFNALMAILEPGDEVILIAPYWMTYADQVALAGGIPVVVPTRAEDGFRPAYDDLRGAMTAKTKAIIINTPSNPTGAAYDRGVLKEITALALRFGLWIISDEIYEKLVYGHVHSSIATLGEEAASQTITVTGCSKSYAMTGWRIGFTHAPLAVAKAMGCLQDQMTSNPTSFAQAGAIAALELAPEEVEGMRAEFEARRDLMVGLMSAMPGVKIAPPKGAFYAFPDITEALSDEIPTDEALALHLLENAHIACVPGSVFAGPGHLRFSYATSREDIERGMARLADALRNL
jgi:aspartate aminotransferase